MAVNENEKTRFDIVICGGSFVGLALARALSAEAPGAFSIAIVEQRRLPGPGEVVADGRTVALTASVKAMLEVIGVWPAIAAKAEPIRRIELTDSALDAPVRPSLINLDSEKTPSGEPTAYIVENTDLLRALIASLEGAQNVRVFAPDSVSSFETADQEVEIKLRSGATLEAKLLVAADGRNSELRDMAGIRTNVWPSDKVGIVATVGIEIPHEGVARQHFLPAGPFAILPMTGDRVSIVWTEEGRVAKEILEQDRETVLAELSRRVRPGIGRAYASDGAESLSPDNDARARFRPPTLCARGRRGARPALDRGTRAQSWIEGRRRPGRNLDRCRPAWPRHRRLERSQALRTLAAVRQHHIRIHSCCNQHAVFE